MIFLILVYLLLLLYSYILHIYFEAKSAISTVKMYKSVYNVNIILNPKGNLYLTDHCKIFVTIMYKNFIIK